MAALMSRSHVAMVAVSSAGSAAPVREIWVDCVGSSCAVDEPDHASRRGRVCVCGGAGGVVVLVDVVVAVGAADGTRCGGPANAAKAARRSRGPSPGFRPLRTHRVSAGVPRDDPCCGRGRKGARSGCGGLAEGDAPVLKTRAKRRKGSLVVPWRGGIVARGGSARRRDGRESRCSRAGNHQVDVDVGSSMRAVVAVGEMRTRRVPRGCRRYQSLT